MQVKNWMEALRVACERHRRPTKAQTLAVAWELFQADMAADEAAKARRGHLAELAQAMRAAANVDEHDDGPQMELDLPGLPAPAYLTVPDPAGGLTIVEYAKSYRPERRAAIDNRNSVIGRIQNRVRDLEQKERHLAAYTPDDATTVEQAIARRDAAQRPRRAPDPDQPGAPPPP